VLSSWGQLQGQSKVIVCNIQQKRQSFLSKLLSENTYHKIIISRLVEVVLFLKGERIEFQQK